MLKELFYECAFEGDWQTINNVEYKFIEKGKTLELYFMGSYQWQDWAFNFMFAKRPYKTFKVHRGFFHCYSQVRNIILDKIYNNDYDKIIVVGYSHGASLCTLAIEDINYHFPNKEIVGYAFESPRAIKCKKKYKYLWDNLTKIETNWDIVAHCPPRLFGYVNVGNTIHIKGDTSLVKNHLPKCIKSHYPQVVLQALEKYEK